ncbi:MAG: insulinase family protein [Gammaproteobacteria bacterium]|nr:insulinase family protein [Gammaproteobacteria bacterium]
MKLIICLLLLSKNFFFSALSNAIETDLEIPNITLPCYLLNDEQFDQINLSNIYHRQLSNGLKVYIVENHELPIFALRLVFDVGAADEQFGEGGYAHLFEHMMFKGSKNVPDGGHFNAIRQIGGQVNASTDYDKTDYWTEAPAKYLERVLWLEAERMQHLMINGAKLNNQRQAVLEEKLVRIDNVPYFKIASEFMVSAWQGTDYDHLIIGTEKEIKSATVVQVQSFFKKYYQPENAVLVLVGDIDSNQSFKKIESYFSNINKKIKPKHDVDYKVYPDPDTKENTSINKTLLSGKSEKHYDPLAPFPLYALGWHTPGKHNSDYYAVELLADILLNHDTSRLKRQLKEEQELIFETIGFPLTFEQAGITAMGMVPHSYADFSQIQSLVRNEIEQIHISGVSEEELCSAKKNRQQIILQKMSNNRQLAELIGDGVLFFDNPRQAISDLKAYQAVDNLKIKQVARHYFTDDWLALEIVPGPGMRFVKWLMELLPQSFSKTIEQHYF